MHPAEYGLWPIPPYGPTALRVFPPRAYQSGRRPRVPPPCNSPTRQPPIAHGTGAGGIGDVEEKMCFIFTTWKVSSFAGRQSLRLSGWHPYLQHFVAGFALGKIPFA